MNLLHPASMGAVVNLWFVNDQPVRLVNGTTRYSVVSATAWADYAGWTIVARSASGQLSRFDVRSAGAGWELSSAS